MCKRPYYAHKHGCPGHGDKSTCPPKAPYVTDILDTNKEYDTVGIKFDLLEHVNNLKINHPNWSRHQLYNCLYYSKGARNTTIKYAKETIDVSDKIILSMPEANGVNLMAMLRVIGIQLKFPVVDHAWSIVMVGYLK